MKQRSGHEGKFMVMQRSGEEGETEDMLSTHDEDKALVMQ